MSCTYRVQTALAACEARPSSEREACLRSHGVTTEARADATPCTVSGYSRTYYCEGNEATPAVVYVPTRGAPSRCEGA